MTGVQTCALPISCSSDFGGNVSPSYNRVIGEGIYIWGAQLNTGSVALPYTATTSTAETLADLSQSTAGNQPLLLVHDGTNNYWWGSGVAGNYCSTPNASSNDIIGDIDFTAHIKIEAWASISSFPSIFTKWSNGSGNSYGFYITGNKRIGYMYSVGASVISTEPVFFLPYNDGDTFFIRQTRVASTGVITSYYKTNESDSWTQLWQITGTSGN